MGKLFRLLLLIVLAPFVYAFALEAFAFVRADIAFQNITWFLIGLSSCLLIYVVLPHRSSKTIRFIEVFRHELAHATVSILFLQMPQIFTVDVSKDEAGKKGETGPLRGWFLAYLAPYYLPVLNQRLCWHRQLFQELGGTGIGRVRGGVGGSENQAATGFGAGVGNHPADLGRVCKRHSEKVVMASQGGSYGQP
jgi:hypothetical protein